MSYGLRVTGGNSILQIDSDTEQLEGSAIISNGFGSSITGVNSSDVILVTLDFPAVPNGSYKAVGVRKSGNTWEFLNENGAAVGVKYIRLAKTTAFTRTESYGLQVKNSSGVLVFDSRAFAETSAPGFTFNTYYPPGAFSGAFDPVASLNTYVSINHGYYSDATDYFSGLVFANNDPEAGTGVKFLSRTIVFGGSFIFLPNMGDILEGSTW